MRDTERRAGARLGFLFSGYDEALAGHCEAVAEGNPRLPSCTLEQSDHIGDVSIEHADTARGKVLIQIFFFGSSVDPHVLPKTGPRRILPIHPQTIDTNRMERFAIPNHFRQARIGPSHIRRRHPGGLTIGLTEHAPDRPAV